jgi:hypothetical protein
MVILMTNSEYYDGTRILSLMDINGNKPELYLITTNRTGGKTCGGANTALINSKKALANFALCIDITMN